MNNAPPSAAYTASVVRVGAAELRGSGTAATAASGASSGCSTTRNAAIARDADDRGHDLRRAEAVAALDQRPAQRRQPDRGEHRAHAVERLFDRRTRLGHVAHA